MCSPVPKEKRGITFQTTHHLWLESLLNETREEWVEEESPCSVFNCEECMFENKGNEKPNLNLATMAAAVLLKGRNKSPQAIISILLYAEHCSKMVGICRYLVQINQSMSNSAFDQTEQAWFMCLLPKNLCSNQAAWWKPWWGSAPLETRSRGSFPRAYHCS